MTTTIHAGGRPRRNRRALPAPGAPRERTRSAAPAARGTAQPAQPAQPAAPAQPVAAAPPGSFEALGVPAPLAAALRDQAVTAPFAIQAATLPDALAGRDILGRAQTGSGKTIAFAVPLAASLTRDGYQRRPGRPGALVLVPTRELAAQVAGTVGPLARAVGLRSVTIHGGVSQGPQVAALRGGADVVVATPGRLEDLIAQGHCHLGHVRTTVLDEADHMADLGFLPAVQRLLDQTPSDGQRLLFSATLDGAITGLAKRYLRHPASHTVDAPDAAPSTMDHHLFTVRAGDKAAVVTELASGEGRSLLFTRTKHGARKLARQLTASGIPSVDLHANLAQSVRQRNLAAFADGSARVLVATDIAARGVHVDDIALVVHVDPPAEHKAYLHRSGRTARAGARGAVVTVATPDQTGTVNALLRKARIRPTTTSVAPGDERTAALTGPPAAKRAPSRDAHASPAPDRRPAARGAAVTRGERPAARGAAVSGGQRPAARRAPATGQRPVERARRPRRHA